MTSSNATEYFCERLGCDAFYADYDCLFEADSDIAGIGIILSFTISVCITFAFVLFGFYFVEDGFAATQLNPLDRLIIRHGNKVLHAITKHDQRLITREAFRATVLSFNDISLVTGLSIMVTAFSKTKTITMYHFAIAGDLASLAFTIQVCAARVTGEDLRSAPEKLWWRAASILILALSILIQTVPFGNQYYLWQYGGSMQCLWGSTSLENYNVPLYRFTMVLWMLLQIWATLSVVDKLFPAVYHNNMARSFGCKFNEVLLLPRKWHFYVLARKTAASARTKNSKMELVWTCVSTVTYLNALFVFIIAEIVYSEALEMSRNWAMLVANTFDIFRLRNTSARYGKVGNEDEWKFGQIAPMFLLLIPLGTLSEVLIRGVRQLRANKAQRQGLAAVVASKPARVVAMPGLSPPGHPQEKRYYFGYSAARLAPEDTRFEAKLYANPAFQLLMPGILTAILLVVTFGAANGWAV